MENKDCIFACNLNASCLKSGNIVKISTKWQLDKMYFK